jgi:hypothetical protein
MQARNNKLQICKMAIATAVSFFKELEQIKVKKYPE